MGLVRAFAPSRETILPKRRSMPNMHRQSASTCQVLNNRQYSADERATPSITGGPESGRLLCCLCPHALLCVIVRRSPDSIWRRSCLALPYLPSSHVHLTKASPAGAEGDRQVHAVLCHPSACKFGRVETQVFANFQLHPVDLCDESGGSCMVVCRMGL